MVMVSICDLMICRLLAAGCVGLAAGRVRGVVVDPDGDDQRSHTVLVGRPRLLEEWSQPLPPELERALASAQAVGGTAVAIGWDGQARGVVVVADAVKPTSREAVSRFRDLGLSPVLLTGDNHTVARVVADQVGFDPDNVIADVLPADKVDVVKRLQADGKAVAMVGDGVNDAAVLAQADLGLSMGTGTDVAIEAGDLVLVRRDLRVAADAIDCPGAHWPPSRATCSGPSPTTWPRSR
jgi:Cu+-exporting ATPase